MVDILLVLLGFFMLTWSFSRQERELDVQMPSASEAKEHRGSVGEVIINVKVDGTLVVNRRPISPDELLDKLTRVAKLYPDQPVVLRADQLASYRYIVEVLNLCQQANIWNVAFATSTGSSTDHPDANDTMTGVITSPAP